MNKNDVLKIIKEHGPVTSREIHEMLGIDWKTGAFARECIHQLRLDGYFIAASVTVGYWLEEDYDAQRNYLGRLKHRIQKIQSVYDALQGGNEMAERREKKAVLRLDDCGECPHFRFNLHGTQPDVCMAEEKEIPDELGIPEWCPLEDWTDANGN